MYAVIFKAKINQINKDYSQTAKRMHELAINKYGCTDFSAVTDGDFEITISYWDDQEQIKRWKKDSEHLIAQKKGRTAWYKSYKVEIGEIIREYSS